jgi:hypothetical protein
MLAQGYVALLEDYGSDVMVGVMHWSLFLRVSSGQRRRYQVGSPPVSQSHAKA